MPFGANNSSGFTWITYFVTGSTPGSYNLTATIKTANDEVPANDSVTIPVIVNPLVNVGVQDFTGPQYLMLGSDFTINATVFTGSRPVPSASGIMQAYFGAQISSMSTGAGTCTPVDAQRFECSFGDLPSGASVPLSIVLHGATPGPAQMSINVSAPGDNKQNDNTGSISFQVAAPGEVSVSTTSSVSTVAGLQFSLPITLQHTGSLVAGQLVTLLEGITLNSMSGSALICTGTSSLDCSLSDWPQGQVMEVDLNLGAASAGSYSVKAKVTSGNDTDTTNNESSAAITVDAAPVTPPPSSGGGSSSSGGGGGGGGSLEWTMLVLLLRRYRSSAWAKKRKSTKTSCAKEFVKPAHEISDLGFSKLHQAFFVPSPRKRYERSGNTLWRHLPEGNLAAPGHRLASEFNCRAADIPEFATGWGSRNDPPP